MWGDGRQNKYISEGRKAGEEVEEGGGRLWDDRPRERSVCLGSGMKFKKKEKKKRQKQCRQF